MFERKEFAPKEFAPIWPENPIKNKGSYLIWFTYNVEGHGQSTHIDHSMDFQLFVEAFQSQFITSYAQGQETNRKAKEKERHKRRQQATQRISASFPSTFSLNKQVMDWAKEYDDYRTETHSEVIKKEREKISKKCPQYTYNHRMA